MRVRRSDSEPRVQPPRNSKCSSSSKRSPRCTVPVSCRCQNSIRAPTSAAGTQVPAVTGGYRCANSERSRASRMLSISSPGSSLAQQPEGVIPPAGANRVGKVECGQRLQQARALDPADVDGIPADLAEQVRDDVLCQE